MEHHIYFDKLVTTVFGETLWERNVIIVPTEMDAFQWKRRYEWSSKVKNINVYPKHFSNKR